MLTCSDDMLSRRALMRAEFSAEVSASRLGAAFFPNVVHAELPLGWPVELPRSELDRATGDCVLNEAVSVSDADRMQGFGGGNNKFEFVDSDDKDRNGLPGGASRRLDPIPESDDDDRSVGPSLSDDPQPESPEAERSELVGGGARRVPDPNHDESELDRLTGLGGGAKSDPDSHADVDSELDRASGLGGGANRDPELVESDLDREMGP